MYISGAKFEEHCFNISGDIFDSVFYCLIGTTCDIIFPRLHNTKTLASPKHKRYSKKENFKMS